LNLNKIRLVSGMRPTGKLHLGHYVGVLENWQNLQNSRDSLFFVADWHALSTSYEDKLNLKNLSIDLVRDWISSGIEPEKANLFIQSSIKEHSELYLILNMITPLGWLERNPTYKDQLQQLSSKDINSAGFLTYPVLQSADILLYDAQEVPIGEDQRPHLEISREIARRFNFLYGSNILTEPKEILSETPKLSGLDGRKMSKSYGNSIYLSDSRDEVINKLKTGKTDPNRIKKTDLGNPDICIIFSYHQEFSHSDEVAEISENCKTAKIGCVECKKRCSMSINNLLEPMREIRTNLTDNYILDVLETGSSKAREIAKKKMEQVNKLVFEG